MSSVPCVLKSADEFHKNCHLVFKDLHDAIVRMKSGACFSGFNQLTYEAYANLSSTDMFSVSHGGFVFELKKDNEKKYYFCFMPIKIADHLIGDNYKTIVCKQLEIDIQFPLILVTGFFKPRSIDQFVGSSSIGNRVRWNWMYNTLLSASEPWLNNSISNVEFIYDKNYCFDNEINLSTLPKNKDNSHWWCENATFKIHRLLDISDSNKVSETAEDLLNM